MRIRLLACLFAALAGPLIAADGDPKNIRFIQRNAAGRNVNLDYVGTSYVGYGMGFDALGVFAPIDFLTQLEWDAEETTLLAAIALKAPLASPTLTGTPAAPTATAGTSTTQIATTAFATGAVATEAATRAAVDANKADLFHTHSTAEISNLDGDKGDITISGSGSVFSIDTGAVTSAKILDGTVATADILDGTVALADMANLSASRLIGRGAGSTGVPQSLSLASNFSLTGGTLNLENVSGDLITSGTISDLRLTPALQTLAGISYFSHTLQFLAAEDSGDSLTAIGAQSSSALEEVKLTGARLAYTAKTTNAGGTTALAVNAGYYDTVTASTTLSITGTVANGSWVAWRPIVSSGPVTVTLPADVYRIGATSTTASISLDNGNQFVLLDRINGQWSMRDSGVDAEAARTVYGNFTTASAKPAFTAAVTALDMMESAAGETTVASATTTDIGAVASRKVSITGTTTITGFGSATAGLMREGRFTGSLTLTYNATSLILPGAANITTAAGDSFRAYSLGTGNWVVTDYTRASGAGARSYAGPGFTVDGGGSAISTGKVRGFSVARGAQKIIGWNIVADTGTATVKVWKIASGTAKPTIANVINTSGVSLSSGTAVESTTVSDFTTTDIADGDIIAFDVTAVSGATELTFTLDTVRK